MRASLLLLLLALAHAAMGADPYTVDNIPVDAFGKDAGDARARALAAGEKEAFAQLILRLAPATAPQVLAQVTHAQVSASVTHFLAADEKTAANHYHATLSFHFNPQQIAALMSVAPAPAPPVAPIAATPPTPVPAAATPAPATPAPLPASKAVLVLPVYNTGDGLELWQDENKWRDVWYEAALESGGGLVVVPLGDMNDRVDVDDSTIGTATTESLKRMYGRYGVGKIVALTAFYDEKADPKPTLEVSLRPIGPGLTEPVTMNYIIHSTETPDGLLVRAAGEIARTLFKEQTIDPSKIQADRLKEISARINTTSMKDWEALRKRLLEHNNIVTIRFVSISYYQTNIVITYRGQSDMLGKTLVASGLRVLQDGDSLVLSLP